MHSIYMTLGRLGHYGKSTAVVVLLAASLAAPAGNAGSGSGNAEVDGPGKYTLNLSNTVVTQAIGPELAEAQARKFVQVQVTSVSNPELIPVSFNVHWRPERGESVFLGTFSLFPPDNPGTFIVPTQGKARPSGSVVVSLVPLEPVSDEDCVQVQLKAIRFVDE